MGLFCFQQFPFSICSRLGMAGITIAVDCMGGDIGPSVTLPACRNFLDSHPLARLILIGQPDAMAGFAHARAQVVAASEVVTMDDAVETALRRKRDSSMRVAIQQVKDGAAQAAVSAGNTGALMAISYLVLRTLDGIDRPAIAGQIPNAKDRATTVLDMGANVDSTPANLLQFAVMGAAWVSVLDGNERPLVGLLNIGEESIKGNELSKQAGKLLRAAGESGDLHFHGNVEGNDIFKGTVDIVVCDGFVGNVALKTAEGLAKMIGDFLKAGFGRNLFTKLAGAAALPVLNAMRRRIDHRRYNGGALLGLRGLVFKSHGSADVLAFEVALARAYDAVDKRLLAKLQERVAHASALLVQDVAQGVVQAGAPSPAADLVTTKAGSAAA
jgi:phosphate acyltransferase